MPLLRQGLEAKDVKIVEDQTFHSGDTDFTGQINAIKAANPDVVQMWGLPADGGRIVAQLRRAGVTATIVGDTAMTDQAVLELAGPAAEGMYAMWIAGAQFLSDDTGPMEEFRARFAKAFPKAPSGMPNQYTIRAYADAYVIAEALRRAGSEPHAGERRRPARHDPKFRRRKGPELHLRRRHRPAPQFQPDRSPGHENTCPRGSERRQIPSVASSRTLMCVSALQSVGRIDVASPIQHASPSLQMKSRS